MKKWPTLVTIGLLTGCQTNPLPVDLMFKDEPVDPECVVATQFGDSSRFAPKPVDCCRNFGNRSHVLNHKKKFIVKDSLVTSATSVEHSSLAYKCDYFESFRYVGSYGDKHVVLTEHYASDGAGHFSELGVVKAGQ